MIKDLYVRPRIGKRQFWGDRRINIDYYTKAYADKKAAKEVRRGDKTHYKVPKVQRLITEKKVRRKKLIKREKQDRFKTSKEAVANYEKLISQYVKEKKAARATEAKEKAAAAETKK